MQTNIGCHVVGHHMEGFTFEDNDIYKRLHELEVKMQSNENTIYSLQSYIDSKANENQYGNLLKECMELQQKINEELLKRYK